MQSTHRGEGHVAVAAKVDVGKVVRLEQLGRPIGIDLPHALVHPNAPLARFPGTHTLGIHSFSAIWKPENVLHEAVGPAADDLRNCLAETHALERRGSKVVLELAFLEALGQVLHADVTARRLVHGSKAHDVLEAGESGRERGHGVQVVTLQIFLDLDAVDVA